MTTNEQRLQQQIEGAVREYMLASRATVIAALERAFGVAPNTPAKRSKPSPGLRAAASVGKRRTASELAALSEQLYEVIATHPGEGMVALSERMGTHGKMLERAVARLRSAGRIRTIGARQQMRYFPRA
jgi:hypothetical protein